MSSRIAYITRRLIGALFVVLSVSTLVFITVRAVPGDPVESMLGETAADVDKTRVRECLHLNDSLIVQYGYFLRDIANLTLGTPCDRPDETVRDRLLAVFPFTVELALTSVALGILIAIPLGVLAALRQGTIVDLGALTVALFGVSIPTFWLGPMLLILFTVVLRVFPDPGEGVAGLATLFLPAVTLGTALSAKLTRMTRASMLEVLSADFVRTARAKGLSERLVVFKHALRNALVPLVTVVGLQIGALLSGTIIVEKIFARPGLGFTLFEAIQQRDFMTVQGAVLMISGVYVVVNLITDLTYVAVDPRIDLEARGGDV